MDPAKIVEQIIGRYGEVIDLRQNPGVIIDIIRSFGPSVADDDGGAPPGGAPPAPSPPGPEPPGPADFHDRVTNTDIMKELLKVSRAVEALSVQHRPARGFLGFIQRLFGVR
jgi:hypothetical protein